MKNPMGMALGGTLVAVLGIGAASLATRPQAAPAAPVGEEIPFEQVSQQAAATVPVSVNWQAYDKGVAKAKDAKKFVFVQFFATWCGYCRKMDNEVFTDPTVKAALDKDFVTVRVTESSEHKVKFQDQNVTEKQLTQMSQVQGFPTFLIMDSEGKAIGKIPGYISSQDIKGILQYVSSASYKTMDFKKFKETVLKS